MPLVFSSYNKMVFHYYRVCVCVCVCVCVQHVHVGAFVHVSISVLGDGFAFALSLSFVFLAAPRGLWDLSSLSKDRTHHLPPTPTTVEAQSPNHWTSREFLLLLP